MSGTANKGDLSGLALRARVFFYPSLHAPTGLWLSPFAQGGVGQATRDGVKRTGSIWAVGASAGWAWLIGSSVHIALGLGGQYHSAQIAGGNGAPSFGRFYPTLDASAGWAF